MSTPRMFVGRTSPDAREKLFSFNSERREPVQPMRISSNRIHHLVFLLLDLKIMASSYDTCHVGDRRIIRCLDQRLTLSHGFKIPRKRTCWKPSRNCSSMIGTRFRTAEKTGSMQTRSLILRSRQTLTRSFRTETLAAYDLEPISGHLWFVGGRSLEIPCV
jgi:hypothetical protein